MEAICTFPDKTRVLVTLVLLKQPPEQGQSCVTWVSQAGLRSTVWVPSSWVEILLKVLELSPSTSYTSYMIKTDTTYNGWTNRQTWSINLTYNEIFTNMCEEQTFSDVEQLADAFESLVDELVFEGVKENSLAWQALGEYLYEVNWEEIANHYAEDFDLFEEEEEEE